jgi:hypothetical protein
MVYESNRAWICSDVTRPKVPDGMAQKQNIGIGISAGKKPILFPQLTFFLTVREHGAISPAS